jgi:hypothetical protein
MSNGWLTCRIEHRCLRGAQLAMSCPIQAASPCSGERASSFFGLLPWRFSGQLSIVLLENGNRYRMKRIEIRHTTRYDFETVVTLGPHTLRVRPREGHDLRIAASALDIVPKAALSWRRDLYDNVLGVAEFDGAAAITLSI